MTAPYQPAKSGQPYKKNSGVIIGNGTTTAALVVNKTIASLTDDNLGYGGMNVLAVSPASSGHLGTFKPYSDGSFGYQQLAGDYTCYVIGSKISGVASTRLRSGATDVSLFRAIPFTEGARRLDITSFSYTTHVATKGVNAGALADFGDDHAARPTDAVPGELVYQYGGPDPKMDDYKPRTNP